MSVRLSVLPCSSNLTLSSVFWSGWPDQSSSHSLNLTHEEAFFSLLHNLPSSPRWIRFSLCWCFVRAGLQPPLICLMKTNLTKQMGVKDGLALDLYFSGPLLIEFRGKDLVFLYWKRERDRNQPVLPADDLRKNCDTTKKRKVPLHFKTRESMYLHLRDDLVCKQRRWWGSEQLACRWVWR